MVDRWNRPTFQDGANIAQGLMTIQNFENNQADRQMRLDDRQTEKDAYAVAKAMETGGDLSGFDDEARFKGAKLKYQNDLDGLNKQIKQFQVSDQGRQQKMAELKTIDELGKRLFNQYQAARRSGDEVRARRLAHEFNNKVAYNGIYIPEKDPDTGKLTIVRQMTGKKDVIEDLPIEQYDQMIAGYLGIGQDEMMNRMLSGEQVRMKQNYEVLSKAEPLFNDKGQVIYRVPAGLWDKDNSSVRGAFYTDDPVSGREIPSSQAKGFKPYNVQKGKKDLGKKEVVNPKHVITGKSADGQPQQGLIVQGDAGPEYSEVKGAPSSGLNTAGPVDPAKAKQAYELKVKKLNTELIPFNNTEAPIFEKDASGNYVLAEGGHNALNAAWKLVQRAQQGGDASLSAQEQQLLPHAKQAVQIYQIMSKEHAQSFALNPEAGKQQTTGTVRMVYDKTAGKLVPK